MMDESSILQLHTMQGLQAKEYPGRLHVLRYGAAASHQHSNVSDRDPVNASLEPDWRDYQRKPASAATPTWDGIFRFPYASSK